nr:PREDICTED: zinc finger BED domain-containing protein RICESLEEPER 2-like [Daucus carota subsp. sativus]
MKLGSSGCTTTLNRHVDKCKRTHGQTSQATLQFQPSDSVSSEVTLGNFKYDHAEMRKVISHYILVNELPFRHVETFMFDKVMRTATPFWQKISRHVVKKDCVSTYEIEKNKLREMLKSVRKINITTDMWTSSHQKIGYMVVTGHWIDSDWKLNMRVLNFCNVPPPHSGFVISEALLKCFNEWGIIDKIGTLTVDNAAANDVALRCLKQTFSARRSLSIDGKMFHARCCAHILNLCVQDGLDPTQEIVDQVRDGVKYIAASESRRIKFAEISMSLGLKCKKLILDVSTRWNSTYNMLSCAIEFKNVFLIYSTADQGFRDYVPSADDWDRVAGVCSFLEVFSDVTKVVSGTEYSTSNLFLSEIRRVKQIIDKKAVDHNLHIREMARKMELKFEKYWGETNLVMLIGAVMDPRFKMKLPAFCFPTLYPIASDAEKNLSYLANALNDLYLEYCREDKEANKERYESSEMSSCDANSMYEQRETPKGLNDYESFIRESGGIIEPTKSELEEYLSEQIVAPSSKFDVIAWWKGNSAKYPILSKMASDVLSIPISSVASESTFSAGSRVIEPHRSCLKPETVEMLLCGADWVRELYGLKKSKEEDKEIVIHLDKVIFSILSHINSSCLVLEVCHVFVSQLKQVFEPLQIA